MVIPVKILMHSSISIICIVSLRFSLCLNNISIPSPAFDNSPDITAPKLIDPLINNIVNAIETAQLGIKPMKAVITGSKNLTLPKIACKIEYFAYINIKKFRTIVISKIKTKMFIVCLIG